MALSLGFSTMLPTASALFSPMSLAACICSAAKATKLINILGVSPNSVALGVSSIVGTIALGFLTDSTMAQTDSDSAFYNGDSPISLRRPTTTTRITNSTPPLLSPDCQGVRSKQILAAFATICASLVGSAYVMYLATQNSFSSSSEHPRDHQRPQQRDRGGDPAPWPLPSPSRRPSRSQPPNRRPDSSSTAGRPCKADTPHNRPLKRPFREDPPPPPPPSLAGFIEGFPKPKNFQELIIMNIMLGALFGWILKQLIGCFPGRRASQRTQHVSESSSLPKHTATSSAIPRKTGDCSRSIPSRSRVPLLPEQRQTSRPLNLKQPIHPVSALLTLTLVGSGTLVLFGLKARCHATNAQHSPNQPIVPHAFRPRDRDSTLAYPVARELGPPAGTCDRSPRSKTTTSPYRRQPSTTHRSPSAVRLSKIEQVRYFYKDDIIGFENGPRSSRRNASAP